MGIERQGQTESVSAHESVATPAVISQLERMIGSAAFEVSSRHKRFLSYVVRETLEGRADKIKAYSIATTVFERGDDFDPQIDPIVRIEAGRLRRALERYYLTSGAQDAVRIEIPKGSYVPIFQITAPITLAPETETPEVAVSPSARAKLLPNRLLLWGLAAFFFVLIGAPAAWYAVRENAAGRLASAGPIILVAPFTYDGQPPRRDVADGLTREIIGGLTRFNGIVVFGPETSFQQGGAEDTRNAARQLGADYLVVGSTNANDSNFKASVSMIKVGNGEYVWSQTFTGRLLPQDLFAAEEQIATEIVQALAQPYGIIFNDQVRALRTSPPDSLSSYECVLSFYQYARKADRSQFESVRLCLEQVTETDPNYALALSSLAVIYCDVVRYGFGEGHFDFDPLTRALQLAERAVELEPQATHGYGALLLIYWLQSNPEEGFRAAERGLALNPNDTDLMANLGGRLYLTGHWERGYALLQEAMARNPGLSELYRIATFFHYYQDGQYAQALIEAGRMNLPNISYEFIMTAAAAGQLGKKAEADAALKQVLAFYPDFAEQAVSYFKKRNLHPDLIRGLVDGLRKAGLQIPDQYIGEATNGNG